MATNFQDHGIPTIRELKFFHIHSPKPYLMALERNGRCNMIFPFEGKPSFQCPKFPSSGPISNSMLSGMSASLLAVFISSPLPFNSARGGVPQRNKTAKCPSAALVFLVKMQCQWIMPWGLWHKALWKFCARRLKQLKLSQEEDIFEEMTRFLSISLHLKKVNSNLSFFDTWVNEMTFQTIPQRNSWLKKIIIIKVAKFKENKHAGAKWLLGRFSTSSQTMGNQKTATILNINLDSRYFFLHHPQLLTSFWYNL